MPVVAGLVRAREAQARFREGLRGRADFVPVATCRELRALVTARTVVAAIVEPRDADGLLTAPTVRWLREGFPHMPVIAYCTLAQIAAGDLLALAQADVSALVVQGIDDAGALLEAALEDAGDGALSRRAWASIRDDVPAAARPVVELCLASARQAPTVADIARALGVHRRTLGDRLARAGLPTPQAIVGWSRLLLAARLMEDPHRPLERIALELRFPGAASLRNMLRRYTGLRARDVRASGGFERVLHAFRLGLRHRRETRRTAAERAGLGGTT